MVILRVDLLRVARSFEISMAIFQRHSHPAGRNNQSVSGVGIK